MQDCRSFSEARPLLKDADVLLFLPHTFQGRLIASGGRNGYSHAGVVGHKHNRPTCIDVRQAGGGQENDLEALVRQIPGVIELYRCEFLLDEQRAGIVRSMRSLVGKPYGWKNFCRFALRHAPVLRWFGSVSADDLAESTSPACSVAVAWAFRKDGVDLVPRLADDDTEPGDLARSALLHYLFTLYSDVPDPVKP